LVPIPEQALGNAARRRASAIAGHTGDELAARAALRDPAHEVRASALGALARIGVLRPDEVSGALADPAPEVRRRACDLAGRLQFGELARQLTEALADPATAVTEAACYALGELEALRSDDAGVEGSPEGGSSSASPPNASPLNASPPNASPPNASPPASADAVEAVRALGTIATSHPEPLCREAAVAALGSLRVVAGLPAVLAALSDKPAVRRRAVVALAGFDGPVVDAALAKAAEDVDWQVRQVAEDLRGYRPRLN
jgi:HEAT repeat protein